ncbi:sialic acid-binding Ig-like lectin 13 [Cetorhinus maximus]
MSASYWTLTLIAVYLIQGSTATNGWSVTVPDSLSALQGSSVIFSCSFQYPHHRNMHAVDITARWLKDPCEPASTDLYNNIAENWEHGIKLIGDLNEKNCSLQISDVQKTHNGQYCFRFEIKNGDKWTGTPGLVLTVYAHPERPNISLSTVLVEGVNTSLICSSSNVDKKAQPSLNWYGIADFAVTQCNVNNSTFSSCLSFIPSYQDHNKVISCSVNYSKLPYSDEGNITLDVKYAPKNITIQVHHGLQLEIKEGDNVSLVCTSNSNPEATYTWYKRDEDKGQAEPFQTMEGTLSLHSISRRASGFYSCVATNYNGNGSSEALEIRVQYKPYEVNISQAGMSFNCMAIANPPAQITWSYTGNVKPVISGNWTNSTLTLQTTSSICVSCQAQNKHGLLHSEQQCVKSTLSTFLIQVIISIVGAVLLLAIVLWIRWKVLLRGKNPENELQPVLHNETQDSKQGNQTDISTANKVYENFCMSESPAEKRGAPKRNSADALVYASIKFDKKPKGLDLENFNSEQAICSGIQDNQVAEFTDIAVYENVDMYKASSVETTVNKKYSEDPILYACVAFKGQSAQSAKH